MNLFETPWDYNLYKKEGNVEVEIFNEIEIVQGGPTIGDLKVNNTIVDSNYKYGGPIILCKNFVYCTVFIKSIFGSGFKIARMNTQNFELIFFGTKTRLINIQKIEGNKISFYKNGEDILTVLECI